jgi:hypothetical protein
MDITPISHNDPEYDRRYPKVRWRGKLYRVHKCLGNDEVRLITMDGKSTVDVPNSEITPADKASTPQTAAE